MLVAVVVGARSPFGAEVGSHTSDVLCHAAGFGQCVPVLQRPVVEAYADCEVQSGKWLKVGVPLYVEIFVVLEIELVEYM